MNFWTAVVVIVLIASIAQVLRARYRSRSGLMTDNAGNETPIENTDPAAQQELEDLRERVKVLERIATDGNTPSALETQRISDEIERLRDKQAD